MRCGWQRYEMKRNVMKWNFVLRLKLTVLSLSCRKSEPNSLASSSPVLIRLFTYYFMNSDRILCSRICLDSIYALKKKKMYISHFGGWRGGRGGGGGYDAVHSMCFNLPERKLKGSSSIAKATWKCLWAYLVKYLYFRLNLLGLLHECERLYQRHVQVFGLWHT